MNPWPSRWDCRTSSTFSLNRSDCDLEVPGRTPSMIIDGREFTWEEFGRMVSTLSGWQFKLKFQDLSEEV